MLLESFTNMDWIGLAVYRLNTYPLIHLGFFHALLNTFALAPLLERFEAEHGTLLTAAMFLGRMSSCATSETRMIIVSLHPF